MYDSMGYLKNRLRGTDIRQECFFSSGQDASVLWTASRDIVRTNGANLLNVSISIVHQDNITALPYVKQDSFAFVLYK
jgi:hypothetical protein